MGKPSSLKLPKVDMCNNLFIYEILPKISNISNHDIQKAFFLPTVNIDLDVQAVSTFFSESFDPISSSLFSVEFLVSRISLSSQVILFTGLIPCPLFLTS